MPLIQERKPDTTPLDAQAWKMAFIVRTDLGMGKGKIAGQVAHAAMRLGITCAQERPQDLMAYLGSGEKKIVLKAGSEDDLFDHEVVLGEAGFKVELIHDAGHTQIDADTVTVLGVGPAPSHLLDEYLGELKLL